MEKLEHTQTLNINTESDINSCATDSLKIMAGDLIKSILKDHMIGEIENCDFSGINLPTVSNIRVINPTDDEKILYEIMEESPTLNMAFDLKLSIPLNFVKVTFSI